MQTTPQNTMHEQAQSIVAQMHEGSDYDSDGGGGDGASRQKAYRRMKTLRVADPSLVSEEEKQKLKNLQAKFGMSNEQVEAIARQVAAEKKTAS